MTKRCPDCGRTLPLEAFYRNRHRGKHGRATYCKPCFNARMRESYRKNKAKRNRQIVESRRRQQLQAAGRSVEPMRCEACGCLATERRNGGFSNGDKRASTKRLAADHDHATGFFRGFLCTFCNRALGYMEDDPKLIRRLLTYVEDRPSVQRAAIA